MSGEKREGSPPQGPHDPDYCRQKAAEMLRQADRATNEEDRETFRVLADQWERLAKVAERPHI